MKKFLLKISLYLLVFFSIHFIVPKSWIYFRFWEKECYYIQKLNVLPLPVFTSNLDYYSNDYGDFNHNYTCRTSKKIHWFTDKYGLRNKINIKDADYLLSGCSNTFGSNTDFKNTFAGILNKKIKIYNCAPDYSLTYIHYLYYKEKPNHIKEIFYVQMSRIFYNKNGFDKCKIELIKYPVIKRSFDYIYDNHTGNKLKKIIEEPIQKCNISTHSYDDIYGINIDTLNTSKNISLLKKKIKYFNNQGIKFSVLVIPDKDIFLKGKGAENAFINYRCVIKEMIKNKINFIDLYPSFKNDGIQNYFHGDSHINEKGHKLISKLIEIHIK
jgi:hypothetical protein